MKITKRLLFIIPSVLLATLVVVGIAYAWSSPYPLYDPYSCLRFWAGNDRAVIIDTDGDSDVDNEVYMFVSNQGSPWPLRAGTFSGVPTDANAGTIKLERLSAGNPACDATVKGSGSASIFVSRLGDVIITLGN